MFPRSSPDSLIPWGGRPSFVVICWAPVLVSKWTIVHTESSMECCLAGLAVKTVKLPYHACYLSARYRHPKVHAGPRVLNLPRCFKLSSGTWDLPSCSPSPRTNHVQTLRQPKGIDQCPGRTATYRARASKYCSCLPDYPADSSSEQCLAALVACAFGTSPFLQSSLASPARIEL